MRGPGTPMKAEACARHVLVIFNDSNIHIEMLIPNFKFSGGGEEEGAGQGQGWCNVYCMIAQGARWM